MEQMKNYFWGGTIKVLVFTKENARKFHLQLLLRRFKNSQVMILFVKVLENANKFAYLFSAPEAMTICILRDKNRNLRQNEHSCSFENITEYNNLIASLHIIQTLKSIDKTKENQPDF